MVEASATKGIDTLRHDYESCSGKPLRIYKAYPEIGRGGIDHDLLSHAEVSRMFDRAMNPPWLVRVANFLKGLRIVPYDI